MTYTSNWFIWAESEDANADAGFRFHAVQRGAAGELGMVRFPEFSELLIVCLSHAANAGSRATTKHAGSRRCNRRPAAPQNLINEFRVVVSLQKKKNK